MLLTKADVQAMTMEQRMELIDLIWEVTDDENPDWKDERSEEEIMAQTDETETTKTD